VNEFFKKGLMSEMAVLSVFGATQISKNLLAQTQKTAYEYAFTKDPFDKKLKTFNGIKIHKVCQIQSRK
jgi:hypothetical protein